MLHNQSQLRGIAHTIRVKLLASMDSIFVQSYIILWSLSVTVVYIGFHPYDICVRSVEESETTPTSYMGFTSVTFCDCCGRFVS